MPSRPIPWVTIALAAINVAVFGWELSAGADVMAPSAQWMAEHGGNFGPVTLDGEQWRLLTSMFLHYGVLHIAMNMIGLLDGGRHVERMYGPAGFLALYLVSGLCGSLASSLRGGAVSAGASGAVFGVFGAFGAYLLLHRDRLNKEEVTKQSRGLLVFLAYNIYFGLKADGIDMMAHVGGLVAGFVAGLALELGTGEDHSTARRSFLVGVVGVALVFAVTLVAPKPNQALQTFSTVESKVLGRWNELVGQIQTASLTDDKIAEVIEAELLPPWREARAAYLRDGEHGKLYDIMVDYLAARQDGWEIMVRGLRTQDPEAVQHGMKRFAEGDAAIEKIKQLSE